MAPPPAADGGEKEQLPPPEMTLGIELNFGFNAQLGDTDNTLTREESVDATYGLGVWVSPQRLYSLGLSYQRIGLGGEESPPTVGNSISIQRDVHSLWLGGRAYPHRTDDWGIFLALQVGMSWQTLDANGTLPAEVAGVTRDPIFACDASDGPGFALGGALGVDVDMGRNAGFIAQLDANGHQLSSDPLDRCAPGSGSATNLGARLGFVYRFDLGDEPARRAERPGTTLRF